MAKIVITDDSRIFRKILHTTLEENGHTIVAEAGNGQEVLAILEKEKADIVTLDITMPIMDGLTTLKTIREKYPDIKVVMVSAAGQKGKVMEALKSGAADFLQKPFQPEDVVSAINKLV